MSHHSEGTESKRSQDKLRESKLFGFQEIKAQLNRFKSKRDDIGSHDLREMREHSSGMPESRDSTNVVMCLCFSLSVIASLCLFSSLAIMIQGEMKLSPPTTYIK